MIDELMNMDGISIGGLNIINIIYADDTVLIADVEEKIQMLVNGWN